MCDKCIMLSKAQAVGEAEERVFDKRNRRTDAKSKGGKRSPEAMVVRKESPIAKLMGKASRMVKGPAMRKVTEVPTVPASMPTKCPQVPADPPPRVPPEVPPVPASMPTKSLDVSSWREANKASRDTDGKKPFHIPLLCVTPGRDNPWRFEVEPILLLLPPACCSPYSSFLTPYHAPSSPLRSRLPPSLAFCL